MSIDIDARQQHLIDKTQPGIDTRYFRILQTLRASGYDIAPGLIAGLPIARLIVKRGNSS